MDDSLALVRERTWAQVDLDAIRHNYEEIRRNLRPGVRLCCVLKANAYGHGASKLAVLYEQLGADFFAVSNIEEALQLRRCGVTRPVLILGYTPASCAALLAENNLSQCVYSGVYGRQLSACAQQAGVRVAIHIKLDTGMGRIGFQCLPGADETDCAEEALRVCRLPGLVPEGVFTHFAAADEGEDGEAFTRAQYERFSQAVAYLEQQGVSFPVRHCANSAAIADYPDWQMNMVRAGIILYGMQPSERLRCPLSLRPAMSLHSVISHVKHISPGTTVSYGGTFTATEPMTVATVPIGYADGFWRSNAAAGMTLTVGGHRVLILGRVCMDQLMVDVTHIPLPAIGDRVVIFGEKPAVSAEEMAKRNGTIAYEITCAVGERVPRMYMQGGRTVDVLDNILG